MEEKRPWHVGRRSLFFCSRFLTSSVNGLVFSATRRLGDYDPSGHPLSDIFAYSATNAYALDWHRCLWRKAIFGFFGFFIHCETVAQGRRIHNGEADFSSDFFGYAPTDAYAPNGHPLIDIFCYSQT